jgi:cytochrome b
MPKPARTKPAGRDFPGARSSSPMARVWDPLVRTFHWSLVASFFVAYFTAHSIATIHHWAGYAAGALVLLRLVWGVLGTPHARFSHFVRHPKTVFAYLAAIARGEEARHLGHNPAGGAMIVALILAMGGTALSGWMMTTDQFWGVGWVNRLHELLAHGLLLLVFVHVGGVVLASLRHRENLVLAMITGRKRPAEPGDVV